MTFLHPWLLWLIPVYIAVEAWIYYRKKSDAVSLGTVLFFRPLATWRTKLLKLSRFFLTASVVFLTVALARPSTVETSTEIFPSGVDIVVALDISGSMAAEDFQPTNRLEVAKDVIRDFIRGRPSDRIGLVLFAGKSVMRSPVTLQHGPLLKTLESVEMGRLPEGTAIGSAIMSAVNRLSVTTTDPSRKTKGDRILLLITDGRNNAGEVHPLDAIEFALQRKIKVYTIAVGGYGKVPFPYFTESGRKLYRYEEADIDENLLKTIAERSGGQYFRASDPKSLQSLFAQINRLEKSEARVEESRVVRNQSYAVMLPALFLVFTYLGIITIIIRYP